MSAAEDEAADRREREREKRQDKARVNALLQETWFKLASEHDKSVLQLASGAVGLLLAFVAPKGLHGTEVWLFAGSLSAFLGAILLLLGLQQVSQHLIRFTFTEKDSECKRYERYSRWLNRSARGHFVVGVVLALTLALAVSIRAGKESQMNDARRDVPPPGPGERRDYSGISEMVRPQSPPAEQPAREPAPPPPPPSPQPRDQD